MTKPEKLKVGIIGVGTIGAIHGESYLAGGRSEIAGIADTSEARLTEIGNRWNVKNRSLDYRDLLKTDVEAVSICVGNTLHCAVALAALRAGKHILLEKPMAMNGAEALKIVSAGKKSGRVVQIGMVRRQSGQAKIVREYVEKGLFGKIYHLRAVMIRRRGIPGLGGWFTTKSLSGGGPLIDIGVHWFDLAMFLSGQWRPTSVSAMTYAKFGPRMRDYHYVSMWAGPPDYRGKFDVEDYATGFVRFGREASLSFELAWAANAEDESYVEILGDQGGARLYENMPLTIYTEEQGRIVNICPQYDEGSNQFHAQFRSQIAGFVSACQGECPPAATAAQGLTVMKLIDAVYRSGVTGREVKIRG